MSDYDPAVCPDCDDELFHCEWCGQGFCVACRGDEECPQCGCAPDSEADLAWERGWDRVGRAA